MRKRLLSFVLAVLMIATLLPVTALAYTTITSMVLQSGVMILILHRMNAGLMRTTSTTKFGANNLTRYLMTVQILFEISATVSLR